MASIEFSGVTNVEVQNKTNTSTSEVIPTNNDQNPNTSSITKVDEETVVSSGLFTYDLSQYSYCKEKSIVNLLKVGESGELRFMEEIKRGVFSISIWPQNTDAEYEKLVEELEAAIPECTQWKNRRPNIGEFVFGQRLDETWVRGFVISVVPHVQLASVDDAKLERADCLATIEEPLPDMYAFSGICELNDVTDRFVEDIDYKYKVTGQTDNEKPDEFEILIFKGDEEIEATVRPWIPLPEQLGIFYSEVNYGTPVCLTGYRSNIVMYIRPIDALGSARFKFILEILAKCAETSPVVENPSIGDKVIAQLPDGNYYRGTICSSGDDSKVRVAILDLGRREYIDREKVKVCPDCLDKLGYCMTQIRIRDVPKDIPPITTIVEYLDNLVENQVPLILTFNGLPFVDGVTLTQSDGETVSGMIVKLLQPYIMKPNPDGTYDRTLFFKGLSKQLKRSIDEMKNESQKNKNAAQKLKKEHEEIKNDPEKIKNEPEKIKNKPEEIKNESEEIKNESEEIKNESEEIKNESEEIKNESEEIKNESEEIKNESEEIKNESEEIKDESVEIKNESEEIKNESVEIKNESEEIKNESQN